MHQGVKSQGGYFLKVYSENGSFVEEKTITHERVKEIIGQPKND